MKNPLTTLDNYLFANVGRHLSRHKKEITIDGKNLGELVVSKSQLAFVTPDEEVAVRSYPKELYEKLESKYSQERPQLIHTAQDDEALLFVFKAYHSTYHDTVNYHYFVAKLEDGQFTFDQGFNFSYSNISPGVISVDKKSLMLDTSNTQLRSMEDYKIRAFVMIADRNETLPESELLKRIDEKARAISTMDMEGLEPSEALELIDDSKKIYQLNFK